LYVEREVAELIYRKDVTRTVRLDAGVKPPHSWSGSGLVPFHVMVVVPPKKTFTACVIVPVIDHVVLGQPSTGDGIVTVPWTL